jgi:UDP-GlcNAc:undecaprenyl-phosphate GlcNAc-1-phosphate transferase
MSNGIRYALAFFVPLAATLILTPLAARLAHRIGMIDHPKENRAHRSATPYLGGLAVAGGLLAAAFATTGTSAEIITILLGALAMAGLGLVDDWRSVGPVVKLEIQTAAGLALWIAGVRAGFFGTEALDLVLTVVWVVAVVNAVNMLDNMDGVTSAVVAASAIGFALIAGDRGEYLVGSLALAVAGSSLGFLRYNFPPAKIFLGDAGTLMMGFLLASLGLKLDLVGPSNIVRAVIPGLLLGVPLFDMVLVVWARLRAHRPFYVGGTDHAAHRLAAHGTSGRTVVLAAAATQVVCTSLAFWLNRASDRSTLAVAVAVGAVALAGWAIFLRMQSLTLTLSSDEVEQTGSADEVVIVHEPKVHKT